MSITKDKKKELMNKFAKVANDTGSVEVQCAVLSERIAYLTTHMQGNKKDFQARRGLIVLVSRRRKLLRYLKGKDSTRHAELISTLGIRG